MPRTRSLCSALLLPAVGLGLIALSGCGPARTSVKGTIVPPADLQLKDDDSVEISFAPEDKSEGSTGGYGVYNAADKSFVVKTADQKGLPPGKYKVGVHISPYGGSQDTDPRKEYLEQFNTNHGVSAGKMSYEVTNDANQNITINLQNDTVTKK